MGTRSRKSIEVKFVGDEDVDNFIYSLNDAKAPGKVHHDNATPTRRNSRKGRRQEIADEKFTYNFGDDSIDEDEKTDWKPTALFDEGDVSGQHVFGFKTPKRRVSTILKSILSAKKRTHDSPQRKSGTPTLIATPEHHVATPKRDVATPKHNVTTPKHNVATPEHNVATPKHNIATPKHNIATPKHNVATPKRDVATPKHNVATPKHNVATPKRDVATPKHSKANPKHDGAALEPLTSKCTSLVVEAAATPYRLRSQLKKRISSLVQNQGQSEGDSEFSPSEDEEVSSDSEASDMGEQVQEKPSMGKQLNFVAATEAYFTGAACKIVTSDRTLARLATPQLSEDTLRLLLSRVQPAHESVVQQLNLSHRQLFLQWILALSEGFTVMLYGVGSKLNLIQEFQKMHLKQRRVVVVNGFFPSLALKDVVDAVANALMRHASPPPNIHECLDQIGRKLSTNPALELYLLVHNLDGTTLTNDRAQDVLSRLAAMPGIRLVASVDHINTQLLWDQSRLSRLNPVWFDATSLLPYTAETSFETSLLVKQSGALALSSLTNVLQSLTSNARGIFLTIARHQLDNRTSSYSGLLFRDLYRTSREQLLVSSDLALRAQLTEFLDHHLVKSKRGLDGSEMLIVPVDNAILERFVKSQSE